MPADPIERRKWLFGRHLLRFEEVARTQGDTLIEAYENGSAFRFAEAFELSEYGAKPDRDEMRSLFPFFDSSLLEPLA